MRKCGKTSKELPTSAQPPCAQDQNVILPTHKKKSRQQPPPASRHWSVLTLDHVVPLFDMRANTSKNIYDIMRSSREALPIQKLMTAITTDLGYSAGVIELGQFQSFLSFMCLFFLLHRSSKLHHRETSLSSSAAGMPSGLENQGWPFISQ